MGRPPSPTVATRTQGTVGARAFAEQLSQFSDVVRQKINRLKIEMGRAFFREVIIQSTVITDTGLFRYSNVVGVGSPSDVKYQKVKVFVRSGSKGSSYPTPRVADYDAIANESTVRPSDKIYITNNADHARAVEFGGRAKGYRPYAMASKTFKRWMRKGLK
jgi:hypothetical protein